MRAKIKSTGGQKKDITYKTSMKKSEVFFFLKKANIDWANKQED